ncbi:MAG: Hsp70 family protein [Myxococcota bacterium]|nr:Hsp70 family protein [Myxococcota bacterium]
MANLAVGIDLGTSYSCVSVLEQGSPRVLPNAYGERTTASVVFFKPDGQIEVGNHAKANIIHHPVHTVSSAKRLIGRFFFSEEVKKARAIYAYDIREAPNHGVRIGIRDEQFSLPEISAMVIREVKQVAEAQLGQPVTQAVITVPAYFNDNQRQATKDAGKIAGVEVLRILNEPTAAALAYGFGRGINQRVAVYDFGGGTFDISILEIGKDVFEVLATCGDTFLGGDDLDDRVLDLLADEFVARHGINPRNDPHAFEKLKAAAEETKKGLSVEDEFRVEITDVMKDKSGESLALDRTITRVEFASLVQDLVQRTFKVCDEALQQSDLTTRDLDGVILVGGPTRLSVIRQAVTDYFQQEPKADVDPDEVVAMGAAIHAASLIGQDAAADSILLDVTPLDLRIGVVGGFAEPVIESNTPVPIEQSRRFTPAQDNQESVSIRVYQGDSRVAEENELLGQFEFSGFTKGRRSEVEIEVAFEINADGIVEVTASDPNTGEQASTSITLSSGLSDGDLDNILRRDRTARVAAADVTPSQSSPRHETRSEKKSPEPSVDTTEAFVESDAIDLGDLDLDDEDLEIDEEKQGAWDRDENEESGIALFDASVRDLSAPDESSEEL